MVNRGCSDHPAPADSASGAGFRAAPRKPPPTPAAPAQRTTFPLFVEGTVMTTVAGRPAAESAGSIAARLERLPHSRWHVKVRGLVHVPLGHQPAQVPPEPPCASSPRHQRLSATAQTGTGPPAAAPEALATVRLSKRSLGPWFVVTSVIAASRPRPPGGRRRHTCGKARTHGRRGRSAHGALPCSVGRAGGWLAHPRRQTGGRG